MQYVHEYTVCTRVCSIHIHYVLYMCRYLPHVFQDLKEFYSVSRLQGGRAFVVGSLCSSCELSSRPSPVFLDRRIGSTPASSGAIHYGILHR